MDSPRQQHIRDRYAELCRLQGRGERSIEGPPRHELYDIAADPGETKDLAGAQPEVVARMRRQYEAWFDDVAARWTEKSKTAFLPILSHLLPRLLTSASQSLGPESRVFHFRRNSPIFGLHCRKHL
jgi:hypothetical protein